MSLDHRFCPGEAPRELSSLLLAAEKSRQFAYAPYSRFRVGAAVLTPTGNIFSGCNVENASFPVGICAEVNAVSSMIAAGEHTIQSVAVCADGNRICPPCGSCRQVLMEFAERETTVYLFFVGSEPQCYRLKDLLPLSFVLS